VHRAAGLGLEGETLFSDRPGRLIELSERAARDGAELLVSVGGDGTLNEVVNGLVRSGAPSELATIPLGTGMDFVRTYGIPTSFDDAVRTALTGRPRTIDAGRVSYRSWSGDDAERYVANVGSVGMSAAVAQRANGMSKTFGGKATFFYALTRVFLEWRNTDVTVQLDDGTRREGRLHDVIVANGQWHGGAMWLAPTARPDDGLFDIVLIGDVTKRDFITTAPKIYKGTYLAHPKVELLRSRAVSVDAPERLPIELDGEQVGTTPARFEIVPSALRVRAPA
jgi:diacylglycerol kinase (ATP)